MLRNDDPIYEYVIVESKKSVQKQMRRELIFTFAYALRHKAYYFWKCYKSGYQLYTFLYSAFVYRKVIMLILWYYFSRSGLLVAKMI